MKDLTIKPLEGYRELPFGMSLDDVIKYLGKPDYQEELLPLDDYNRLISFDYEVLCMKIYLEGVTNTVISSFSICTEEALLYGEKVFELDKIGIKELMRENNIVECCEECDENGDCLIYDDLRLDFYFESGKLVEIVWGVSVDAQGNIETV